MNQSKREILLRQILSTSRQRKLKVFTNDKEFGCLLRDAYHLDVELISVNENGDIIRK
jgi:hypothetical protein